MKNYFILPHPSERKLLLLEDQGGRSLPHLELREPILRRSQELNEAAHGRYGVTVRTLRYLAHNEKPDGASGLTVYECENLSPDWAPSRGMRWAGLEEVEARDGVDAAQVEIIRRWLGERSDAVQADVLPPWSSPGWYAKVSEWVERRLSAHGMSLAGPVRQIRVSSISCVLKVPSTEGGCFFKAVPEVFRSETGMTERLAALYPQNMPSLLAVEHARHWMLMRRLNGTHLDQNTDTAVWEGVLRRFAQIQAEFVGRADDLLDRGCINRPLRSLPDEVDQLWEKIKASTNWKLYGLNEEMVRLLVPLAPQIKGWCEELAAYGLPETLIHGDLHAGNFVLEGEHPVFFDWSDAAITHPFFDMLILMESGGAEWRDEIKAYLEPWIAHAPMSRLEEAFELAFKVAHVYHSLSYLRITENLTPETQWEMADGVGFLLQKLLAQVGLYVPPTG